MESDFPYIQKYLQPKQPCYVLLRLDNKNMTGFFDWILIHYAPEGSTVKDRMLYASTRELLKRQLGTSNFCDELFASTPAEATLEAYIAHRAAKTGARDVPLTATEVQAAQERTLEVAAGTSKEYVHGVRFPLASTASEQLAALAAGRVNLVLLTVDVAKETIELAAARSVPPEQFHTAFPKEEPCFGLYAYPQPTGSTLLFVYSCPASSKVKLKMLYSTVKSAVLAHAEEKGLKVEKKLEVQSADELSVNALHEELAATPDEPKAAAPKLGFEKPQRPGRGAPRLIKK